jgi:hypothetical protein
VYEVYPPSFHRIIPRIRALAENPRPSGCPDLLVQGTIAELELEIIGSFTRTGQGLGNKVKSCSFGRGGRNEVTCS